eukprot:TRINITY_DN4826_c0_g1_i1.p2 TRINITY_DN4826_c0_g1~~TRINITY_DN4826_c0_g1_i1.p2  ORF type:complete len:631 (-),score=124.81 TRINITY_DN4826_c0_g1_i1:219-2111(-)
MMTLDSKLPPQASSKRWYTLETLPFDNLALRSLPIDPIKENYVRIVNGACFSMVQPAPLKNPVLVSYSKEAIELLGINEDEAKRPDFAEYFAGNKLLPGSQPAAHCYVGHQFGSFAGQLGDGRAMYLGEILNSEGDRWEIQFKGAGKTPYSRTADGRAVLRSSIREFLCSEAMFHLGVPTTRAGTLVTSDTPVERDPNYDGHVIEEKGTVVLRIAPSFIRFGSFQICNAADDRTERPGPSYFQPQVLPILLDYTIKTLFPHIFNSAEITNNEDRYAAFFKEVVERTAVMVSLWQAYGFVHGVMNTDNMSILGLTIDYGPFGFLSEFSFDYTPNTSDKEGRYSYKNQPDMCYWNLEKLAEGISKQLPLARSKEILTQFWTVFNHHYNPKMRAKLGLMDEQEEDVDLIRSLLETMDKTGTDFNNTFRNLKLFTLRSSDSEPVRDEDFLDFILTQTCSAQALIERMEKPKVPLRQLYMLLSIAKQSPQLFMSLTGSDPSFIFEEIERLEVVREQTKHITPEKKLDSDRKEWTEWAAKYRRRLDGMVKNLASVDLGELRERRRVSMDSHNPKFILRNYMAQVAIEKAEKGDFSEVNRLLDLLREPFSEGIQYEEFGYDKRPPEHISCPSLSCSS